MRAILRAECDKTLAAVLEFLVLFGAVSDRLLAQSGGVALTEAEEEEVISRLVEGGYVEDSGVGYFVRASTGVDVDASETEAAVYLFNMIIEDLKDGEC